MERRSQQLDLPVRTTSADGGVVLPTPAVRSGQWPVAASPHEREFNAWKATKYGAHLLEKIYRTAAVRFADNFVRRGRQVSMKLIFELVRYDLPWIKRALSRRGIRATKVDGFALNNNFTAPAARHLMNRRQEWQGMFELRHLAVRPPGDEAADD